MLSFLVSVTLTLAASGFTSSEATKSYQLSFPITDHQSYVTIPNSIPKPMEALTLCLWERPLGVYKTGQWHWMFGYAVEANSREIEAALHNTKVHFQVGTDYLQIGLSKAPQNGVWTHYCFAWSYYGKMEIYENGIKLGEAMGKEEGHRIPADGITILGQYQTKFGGGFQPVNSWRGDLSEVQLWNYVLCPNLIAQLANCTSDLEGNVIPYFSSVLSMKITDQVSTRPVSLCKQDQCSAPLYSLTSVALKPQ